MLKITLITLALTACLPSEPATSSVSESTTCGLNPWLCTLPDAHVSTFNAPVGAACDPLDSYFCAGGLGVCVVNICRAQCMQVYSQCPVGETPVVSDLGRGPQCYCQP